MKQQPWMVSIEYRACFGHQSGSVRRQDLQRTILVIDTPPWRYVAEARQKLNELYAKKDYRPGAADRADEITAIFWAVQVPIAGLSEEEVDMLS